MLVLIKNHMEYEDIKKLHELTKEQKELEEIASEKKRTAEDRYGDREHTIERDGEEVTINEKTMWQEVFMAGEHIDSAKILKEEHPDVFKAYKKQGEKAEELNKHCKENLGVDYRRMRLSDYVELTEKLIDLKLN